MGWENKYEIESARLTKLNEHIAKHQPSETEIYLKTDKGRPCVNLISVKSIERLYTPIHVSFLTKTSNNTPLKSRTTSGGWSYVEPLPDWVGTISGSAIKENFDTEFQRDVDQSMRLKEIERNKRLENASRYPEVVQTISRGFRRNPDVAAAVFIRANGKCEQCKNNAPFIRSTDGTPYLEVHHKIMLSEGGEDTVENTIAVCPNCHRELHFGIQRD